MLIDGEPAATVEAGELAQGWNMATAKGPITAQARQVLQLVCKKNAEFFLRWRAQLDSRHAELPSLDRQIAELEDQLNATRAPKTRVFTLKPK